MKKRLQTYVKDRMVLLLLALCIISCAIASAVYAKYIKDHDSDVNVNIVGSVDLETTVVENSDGSYTIKHDTDSNISAYIRFTIVVNWKNEDGVWYISPSNVQYDVPNAQLLGDGYYYAVCDGSAEIDVGTEITDIRVSTTMAPPSGYELSVQIVAEAIQCVPADSVEDAWGVRFENGSWVKLW